MSAAPPRIKNSQSTWTDAEIALTLKMWGEGHTATEISQAMGGAHSRSGVLGWVDRNRERYSLARSKTVRRQSVKLRPRTAQKNEGEVVDEDGTGLVQDAFLARPAGLPEQDSFEVGAVSLMDIAPQGCRWPVSGEGVNMLFCGQPARAAHSSRARRSYCQGHGLLATGKTLRSLRLSDDGEGAL